MNVTHITSVILIFFALSACNNHQPQVVNSEMSIDTNKVSEMPQSAELANTEWVLVELAGKNVVQKMSEPKPLNLRFSTDGKVTGFAGCNGFGGNYEIMTGSRIKIANLISTMMACEDLEIENEYKRALETADNYNLSDSALVLNKAKMAPLARLKRKS